MNAHQEHLRIKTQTNKVENILNKIFNKRNSPCSASSFSYRRLKIFLGGSDLRIYMYSHSLSKHNIDLKRRADKVLRTHLVDGLSGAEEIATLLEKEVIQAYE